MGFLLIALQCAAVLLLVHRFEIENELFQQVVTVAFAGFAVHHWLPMRWRLPFFAILSLGSVAYFFGLEQRNWIWTASLARTATLLGLGGALIGLCHLPVRFALRVGLLLAAGASLAVFRAGWMSFGPLDAIWPVFGAMFMFRIMLYAYDVEHAKTRPTLWQTLSYFFLFPAMWLFVFPVIDFTTFRSTYFTQPPIATYQRGVDWMFRGIIQLLLWRLVYYDFYVDPSRITNGTDLIQYMAANMGLYLRVSGEFHFVIGLLHLFGFHLPETHRRYWLASSLMDYWRRVNIYWKDFVTKLFFYPIMVRLRSWPDSPRVLFATAVAFVATWLLHSYQWFWLRGAFPIEPKDMVLWGGFGVMVGFNSIRELKRGRVRSLRPRAATWRDNLRLGVQTAGTFLIILLLWSVWSCDNLEQWVEIWKLADVNTFLYGMLMITAIGVAAVVMEGPASPWVVRAKQARPEITNLPQWRHALVTCLVPACIVVVLGSSYRVREMYPTSVAEYVKSLSRTTPNTTDQDYMVRGYYENLMDGTRFSNLLNGAFNTKPPNIVRFEETPAGLALNDMRILGVNPNQSVLINGKQVTTNRWGMRDKDYDLEKAPGTLRIAILGASHEMGEGVNDADVFEKLVEDRLNQVNAGPTWKKFEILNFAVNASSPISHVLVMDKKLLPFKPDVLLYFPHVELIKVMQRRLAESVRKNIDLEYDYLRDIVRQAGVTPATSALQGERLLTPYWDQLMLWAFREIIADCRVHGIRPLWIYVPGVDEVATSAEMLRMMELAEQAGFPVVRFGHREIYRGGDPKTLVVAPWDAHPNAAGHRLIADAVYQQLLPLAQQGLEAKLR